MRAFLDTNVVLDFLADRAPFAQAAADIFSLSERGEIEIHVAAHTVTTVFHLLRRDLGSDVARLALMDLFQLVEIVTVDRQRLLQALAMDIEDYEDALQAVCAMLIEAEFLVTRNPRDFPPIGIEVILPEPFLARIRES